MKLTIPMLHLSKTTKTIFINIALKRETYFFTAKTNNQNASRIIDVN